MKIGTRSRQVPLHPDVRAYLALQHSIRVDGTPAHYDRQQLEALVIAHARELAASAIKGTYDGCDMGCPWEGPPFDVKQLASALGHHIVWQKPMASEDAELHPIPGRPGEYKIYCNPESSESRQNFNIAHELGHTIIPPINFQRRSRHVPDDPEHQVLERLCNLAASELLLPYAPFVADLQRTGGPRLESLDELSSLYRASPEAVARRMVSVSQEPLALAFFSMKLKPKDRKEEGQGFLFDVPSPQPALRVDYCLPSAAFVHYLPEHKSVPEDSPLIRVLETQTPYVGPVHLELKSKTVVFQVEACHSWGRVLTLLRPVA